LEQLGQEDSTAQAKQRLPSVVSVGHRLTITPEMTIIQIMTFSR
jgi:hypothetical protein